MVKYVQLIVKREGRAPETSNFSYGGSTGRTYAQAKSLASEAGRDAVVAGANSADLYSMTRVGGFQRKVETRIVST